MLATIFQNAGLAIDFVDTNFLRFSDKPDLYSDYHSATVKSGQNKPVSQGPKVDHLLFDEFIGGLQQKINDHKPAVIAVSSVSDSYPLVEDMIGALEIPAESKLVLGGVNAHAEAESIIGRGKFDYVFEYHADETFLKLFRYITGADSVDFGEIDGLWFKKSDGSVGHNPVTASPDLTKLPTMELGLLDPRYFVRPYDGAMKRIINYESSRGCPFGCTYCINSAYRAESSVRGSLNRKPVDQIIDELVYYRDVWAFEMVVFMDETFLAMPEPQFEEIARRFPAEVGLPFTISTRIETLTEKRVALLAGMGCCSASIGLESGSESLRRKIMSRTYTNKQAVDAITRLKKAGIRTSTLNIIGTPGETEEMIHETIELNKRIDPATISVSIMYPYAGTVLRRRCLESGSYDPAADQYRINPVSTSVLNLADLSTAKVEYYFENFVRLCRN